MIGFDVTKNMLCNLLMMTYNLNIKTYIWPSVDEI